MSRVYFITHPDVEIDPAVPITRWPLSALGRRRMRSALAQPWAADLSEVFSSDEQKAVDGAEILCRGLDLPRSAVPELGEVDRSATGFLPGPEFWDVVEAFFAEPDRSARGWERAAAAQDRVAAAVERILASARDGSLALVSHGSVGALLLCRLKGAPISRSALQPDPPASGDHGGFYFSFERESRRLLHGWRAVDASED